jgi:hypothetical protein
MSIPVEGTTVIAGTKCQSHGSHTGRMQYGNTVKASMMKLFDWIGTTEDLYTNTLPLLSKMLDLPSDFEFERHRVTAEILKKDQYLGMENLTASTLQSIESMSYLDLELYEHAQQRYPYQMWKDNICTDGL